MILIRVKYDTKVMNGSEIYYRDFVNTMTDVATEAEAQDTKFVWINPNGSGMALDYDRIEKLCINEREVYPINAETVAAALFGECPPPPPPPPHPCPPCPPPKPHHHSISVMPHTRCFDFYYERHHCTGEQEVVIKMAKDNIFLESALFNGQTVVPMKTIGNIYKFLFEPEADGVLYINYKVVNKV